jgi:hypothetical protein
MVELRGAGRGTGVVVRGGTSRASLTRARITGHRIGAVARERASLEIQRSWVTGNSEWGVRNEEPTSCLRAVIVWWGSPDGPNDPTDARDGCMNRGNTAPGADRVSEDVRWEPYASDEQLTPVGGANAIFLPLTLDSWTISR